MSRSSETTPVKETDVDVSSGETSTPIPHDLFMDVINANYGRYIKKAYSYLKHHSLAEDAVQEGILTAYKKLNTVRDINALNSWITRIIAHKALDILRKNKRMPNFYADIDDIVSYTRSGFLNAPLWAETSTPEQDIMKKENLELLKKAIEDLPDKYRIPLLMKDYEDFSIAKISEMLEISESNAKVRIHRARMKVKLNLDKLFFPYQSRGNS